MKEDTTHINPTWMERTGGYAKDMTLRDYFAAKALQGILMGQYPVTKDMQAEEKISIASYQLADSMLKARRA